MPAKEQESTKRSESSVAVTPIAPPALPEPFPMNEHPSISTDASLMQMEPPAPSPGLPPLRVRPAIENESPLSDDGPAKRKCRAFGPATISTPFSPGSSS